MVRKFLGNIKGERGSQGPQGPQGERGSFEGQAIDIINLLDFSEIHTYGEGGEVNYDPTTGVLNYSELAFYFRVYIPLKPKKYYFRVPDYTSHSGVYGGRFRLRIESTGGDPIFNEDIAKNSVTEVDLTNDVERVYEVRFYIASSEPLSGYIEKPMLTEGEYPVLWNTSLPEYKKIINKKEQAHRQILYGYTIDKEETKIKFVANDDDTIKFNDGFILDGGIYQINFNLRTQNTDSVIERNRYRIKFYIDDVLYLSRLSDFNQQNLDVSFSMPVDSGVLTITSDIFTKDTSDDSIPLFTGKTDSQISIVKLGGF